MSPSGRNRLLSLSIHELMGERLVDLKKVVAVLARFVPNLKTCGGVVLLSNPASGSTTNLGLGAANGTALSSGRQAMKMVVLLMGAIKARRAYNQMEDSMRSSSAGRSLAVAQRHGKKARAGLSRCGGKSSWGSWIYSPFFVDISRNAGHDAGKRLALVVHRGHPLIVLEI
ncbi:hypothetical protein BV20DRAFT_626964 [Pilatotrama ljubarskyi]|nr:hypothetical protein BV20DRAFT_626964 [Pilatotrama ljubarskyi]